jgi:putative spermidine/putrescine transport system permease protein
VTSVAADGKVDASAATETAVVARQRRRRVKLRSVAAIAYVALVFVVLLAPLIVVVGGSFSAPENDAVVMSYVQFPPKQLTLKWYREIPPAQLHALGFSFALALSVALAACCIGVPAALGLVRGRFAGKSLIAAILRAPLQIPHIVTGIALLQLYYAFGDAAGINLQGTVAGLFLGHLFLATPFVTGSVAAVLLRFNRRFEEVALTLGASPWRTLRRVTLPVIVPGIFSGGLYAFIVSFVDVPVAMFLGASDRTTYPVELFYAMEQDFNPSSLASASLTALLALLLVAAAQRLVGLDNFLKAKSK